MTEISEKAVEQVKWMRVNAEPFEYAIQQGPHGDEFVKLLDGSCLRRALPLHDDAWQLIETAPQDEVLHMGWWHKWPPGWLDAPQWRQEIGTYRCTKGGWRHGQATHWRPLASPPSEPNP